MENPQCMVEYGRNDLDWPPFIHFPRVYTKLPLTPLCNDCRVRTAGSECCKRNSLSDSIGHLVYIRPGRFSDPIYSTLYAKPVSRHVNATPRVQEQSG